MDKTTIDARIRAEQQRTFGNIALEDSDPSSAVWLSFAGEEGFRGAIIIHANDFMEAIMRTNLLGINPHGEVAGMDIPAVAAAKIPAHWKNRLLNREECEKFDEEMSAR